PYFIAFSGIVFEGPEPKCCLLAPSHSPHSSEVFQCSPLPHHQLSSASQSLHILPLNCFDGNEMLSWIS
ncbi:hypothetical protein, partial [Salmonella enterica]|uniref:hypothetical protein n=1 Tax=Salmonella enterica TaxID=28901 RepID=UPI000AA818A9